MKKILIIKSSSMGDIIHALPVAHDIRQALPDARIDWVAEESFADMPRRLKRFTSRPFADGASPRSL